MTALEKFELWKKKVTDEDTLLKLKGMEGNGTAIENAFFKELEFGTGGLRGEIGAGTNCLNVYTIAKVTQGIADCMKKHGFKKTAVSYDSRIKSDVFARRAAEVFAANGIKTVITKELMPTPFLSFLTRETKADIGVMITASHNPAKYNGYKVYGGDGCQLTDERATEMIGYIDSIDPFDVKTADFEQYEKQGLIEYACDCVTEQFLNCVQKQNLSDAKGLKVVYSPLNGTGYKLVPEIMRRIGVDDIFIVPEQGYPDGNFTTCSYPNPEKAEALFLALEAAKKTGADLLLATDPDCDRLGIAVRQGGEYRLMTGNEVGVLLIDYIFTQRKLLGNLPANPLVIKTIVTTALGEKVAAKYGAQTLSVLTGFKYIGDIIGKLEAKGEENRFILGFEESYGYLAGSYVRDKDAVVGAMLVCEMAKTLKKAGKTLVDRINELYAEFGTYEHKLLSFEYAGASGNAKMKELLKTVRENTPTEIGGSKVIDTVDYLTQTRFDLPRANVLSYYMENGSQLVVRPSGTEPLIKMYITTCKTREQNKADTANITETLNRLFKA